MRKEENETILAKESWTYKKIVRKQKQNLDDVRAFILELAPKVALKTVAQVTKYKHNNLIHKVLLFFWSFEKIEMRTKNSELYNSLSLRCTLFYVSML